MPRLAPEPQDDACDDWDEDWDEEEEDEDEGGGGWVACHLHPAAVAVTDCQDCGATLCEYCLHRFQPPSCPSCVLAWTTRRRAQLLLPLIWFFGVLGLGSFFFLQPLSEHQENLNAFWIELGCTYVLASVPTGRRSWATRTPTPRPLRWPWYWGPSWHRFEWVRLH
jgi:hypothetical protein